MNRVGDYIKFAVLFSGVGYVVLWSLSGHDGIAMRLSPGLHLAGMTASACMLVTLALQPLRRRRRARSSEAGAAAQVQDAMVRLGIAKKPPPPPYRYVQPRTHFGLRNPPQ